MPTTDITDVYFAVPTHYTIGTRYESFAEAKAAALAVDMNRWYVDVRVVELLENGNVDDVAIRRIQVGAEADRARNPLIAQAADIAVEHWTPARTDEMLHGLGDFDGSD